MGVHAQKTQNGAVEQCPVSRDLLCLWLLCHRAKFFAILFPANKLRIWTFLCRESFWLASCWFPGFMALLESFSHTLTVRAVFHHEHVCQLTLKGQGASNVTTCFTSSLTEGNACDILPCSRSRIWSLRMYVLGSLLVLDEGSSEWGVDNQ